MNKYGTMKTCPKCGHSHFSDGFASGMVRHDTRSLTGERYVEERIYDEYIERTCLNCGYAAKEKPLDAKDEQC